LKESLSHTEFDSDTELDDCFLLPAVVNGNGDEDDYMQDFVCEDM
jgi:hypothetical protein